LDAPEPDERHLLDPNIARRGRGSTGSILLVEDDDEVAVLVSDMPDQLGYEVTRAASTAVALGALANGRAIDIIFPM
jgi:DNA-binding NtrC family response regulator